MTKDESLFLHAQRRAWQRYGIDLSRDDYNAIGAMLTSTPRKPGYNISCRKYATRVTYNQRRLYLVWDRKRGAVITFLTLDMYQRIVTTPKKKKRATV